MATPGNTPNQAPSLATTTKGTTDPYVQPPFDPRITTLPRPFLGQYATAIRRGFLVWDKTLTPPSPNYNQNQPAQINFLFNPSTISTSYQLANGSAQAALNYSNNSLGSLLLPMQQQTSFTIMFDRTYELNDPSVSQQNSNITNFGVDVDIAAIKQYTGMFANIYKGNATYNPYAVPSSSSSSASASYSNPANASQTSAFNGPIGHTLSQGIMQVTIGYCFFGGLNTQTNTTVGSTSGALQAQGVTYYGYIDSWSVEYTHFTQFMVPMRAVVDISFTLLPPPAAAGGADAGAAAISKAQAGGAAVATAQGAAGAIQVAKSAIATAIAGR